MVHGDTDGSMTAKEGGDRRAARVAPWLVSGLGVAALLVMMEISRLLGALESAGARKYSMSAFTGWPGLPPWSNDDVGAAIVLWSQVARELSLVAAVQKWAHAHVLIDALVFAPAYAFGLYCLLRFLNARYKGEWPPLQPTRLALLVFGFDELENVLTWIVLDGFDKPSGLATGTLGVVTACKWVALAGVLSAAALRYLAGRQHRPQNSGPPPVVQLLARPPATEAAARAFSRHRTQLGIVLVLGALLVLPSGGPLEQLPDILRAWTDGPYKPTALAGDLVGPVLTLVVLCAALWIAGRLALLDGAPTYRRPPRPPIQLLLMMVVGFGVGFALWQKDLNNIPLLGDLRLLGWGTGAVFAVPVVLFAVLLLGWLYKLVPWSTDGRPGRMSCEPLKPPTGDNRRRVRDTGRVLAVVPLALAGLGLVRAFAAPLLLAGTSETFPLGEALGWFIGGLALVPVAALAERGLGKLEAAFLGDRTLEQRQQCEKDHEQRATARTREDEQKQDVTSKGEEKDCAGSTTSVEHSGVTRRRSAVLNQGRLLLLTLLVVAGWIAFEPLKSGRLLRTLGVLQLFLATVVLIGGFLVRQAELREPLHALGRREQRGQEPERRHGFARTPVWLLILVVFVVAGRLDTTGGHHDVRLADSEQGIDPAASVQQLFKTWLAQAAACSPKEISKTRSTAVPLLLLAAPGGGIRAAYWTGSVVDRLTDAATQRGKNCQALFAASGVSGGGLGLVGFAAANANVSPAMGSAPASNTGKQAAEAIAGEDAVGAVVAAALYRDLPRGFHGINRFLWWDAKLKRLRVQDHDDRAAVLERVWERRNARLLADFYRDLRPPDNTGKSWRPLLLLNGTDAASGCRVLVSPLQGASPATSCLDPATARTSAQFATGALDAYAYLDQRGCDEGARKYTLRLSTAALLSARFAWVTPTGTMVRCFGSGSQDPATAAVIDGGYLEGSGIASLLELWDILEPVVASHNRAVAGSTSRIPVPYVVPLFALLDNHYSSVAVSAPPGRVREITAPLVGRSAPQTVVRSSVLEQAALLRFAGSPPGLSADSRAVLSNGACIDVRSFHVAPRKRPGVEAPLGWVLSDYSTNNLDVQLENLWNAPASQTGQMDVSGRIGLRRPSDLSVLKASLQQQLSVRRVGCFGGGGRSMVR
jgi:hypothetical protein